LPIVIQHSASEWLDFALRYGPLFNLLLFVIGLIFTWRQFRHARISREQQNYSAILARSSDINTRTEGNLYRKIAAEYFMNADRGAPAIPIDPIGQDQEHNAYWGSRSYFLDLIILILQVWLLAERPTRLRGDFAGWEIVARSVSKEIRGLTYAGKPGWYIRACDDLFRYMQEGRVYPPNFVKYMDALARQ
jgi:hypothetical protein